MEVKWKPEDRLIAILEECGIDSDIIDGTLNSSLDFLTSNNPLILARQFTQTVIAEHISWSNSTLNQIADEPSLFIEPQSYIRKGWRPREETLSLLTDILHLTNRVEIGFVILWFIDQYKGVPARSWDSLFIQYAFARHDENNNALAEEKKSSQSSLPDDKLEPYPEAQRLKNIAIIRGITADLLKTMYVTPFFNKPLDVTWQPSKWVVQKLQERFNLSKRFIFNQIILQPFISFHAGKGKIFDNYNTLYFHWVLKRFRFQLKYLQEEKKRLEKLI